VPKQQESREDLIQSFNMESGYLFSFCPLFIFLCKSI